MMLSSLGGEPSPVTAMANSINQVMCHPKQLEFFMDDLNSHKAITSLYNPYDFPIKFKVLSTAPKKYTVTDPEGYVNPKSSVNLVIKHSSQSFESENVIDKLRIQIYQMSGAGVSGTGGISPNKPNLLAKRDLPLYSVVSRENHLLALIMSGKSRGDSPPTPTMSDFNGKYSSSSFAYGNNLNDMIASSSSPNAMTTNSINKSPGFPKSNLMAKNGLIMQQQADNVNYLVILLGLVCLGILFLPLIGSTDSYLPVYLHVTHEIKLISTFILGMVTMVILKT